MALWRDGAFAEDDWTFVADDAAATTHSIVSLARWRREAETLRENDEIGVELVAGRDAQSALAEISDRPLLALRFEKFGDGRAFSYAILLRRRCGFRGDLRAVGEVLLDEIPLMLRCGFTSFEVTSEATLRALREGRLPIFPLAYQPGLSAGETRVAERSRARRLELGTIPAA